MQSKPLNARINPEIHKRQKALANPCIKIINARTETLFIGRFFAQPDEA